MIKIDEENDIVIFGSTGRQEYCFGGEFAPNGEASVSYGLDGKIKNLTRSECAEMAFYMIDRWQAWLVECDRRFEENGEKQC